MANAVRDALLTWYDEARRDLPWRRTRDPYAIWVSEVMLQQTRVDTVVPYYRAFMERFPSLEALAAAGEDAVMAAWSGLGYYRRARLLHAGAREVVARYGGRVPVSATARRTLPGVGRYTAGAIGSIAFDREEPIVDGNVARVLARLRGIDTPLGQRATEERLWAEAAALVRGARPGDLNQALMELGATVCAPSSPRCTGCPVRAACAAHRDGRADALPVPRARKAPREVALAAVVATAATGAATWLVRGEAALFGGLWSLPCSEGSDRRAALAALRAAGIRARLGNEPLGDLTHVLTHRRLTVQVWSATHARAVGSESLRKMTERDLKAVGVSRLTRKILALHAATR